MLQRTFSGINQKVRLNVLETEFFKKGRMNSWVINSYGDINELQLKSTRIPVIFSPDDVIVKIHASSINPIDKMMLGGYGRTLIHLVRDNDIEFPLTLGRDFSGVVLSKGHGVGKSLNVGDPVYGFSPLYKQGSFSDLILVNKNYLQPKPPHLKDDESTCLVYAGMTAWSALFRFGNLSCKNPVGTKVLIMGASGGVGTIAVQLLKSQGCTVCATCATDAVDLMKSLGAHCVFDYSDENFSKQVEEHSHYDIILDCAKIGYQNIPKSWKYGSFITLNSPLLHNTDNFGLLSGLFTSSRNLICANYNNLAQGRTVMWGFFVPSPSGFQFLHKLIMEEKIKPLIHKRVNFEKLPEAFEAISEGHLRGKIVINHNK